MLTAERIMASIIINAASLISRERFLIWDCCLLPLRSLSPVYTNIVPYYGYIDGYIRSFLKCFYVIFVPFLFDLLHILTTFAIDIN